MLYWRMKKKHPPRDGCRSETRFKNSSQGHKRDEFFSCLASFVERKDHLYCQTDNSQSDHPLLVLSHGDLLSRYVLSVLWNGHENLPADAGKSISRPKTARCLSEAQYGCFFVSTGKHTGFRISHLYGPLRGLNDDKK